MNKSTAQFDSCVAQYSLLAYPYGMSRTLRAARLALELLATIYKGIL